jgi:hypothetical protein
MELRIAIQILSMQPSTRVMTFIVLLTSSKYRELDEPKKFYLENKCSDKLTVVLIFALVLITFGVAHKLK